MNELDGESLRPIEKLSGQQLNARWTVLELVQRNSFQTGSCFSVGYIVANSNGGKAFAKILDFSRALQANNTVDALKEMTEAYVFERDLLEICNGLNLTRVVKGLDHGEIPCKDVPLGKLFFLVFEVADGDIRRYMSSNSKSYLSWRLGILHDAAIGLNQLHAKKIFHQDLKPSNILVFEDGTRSKLADLGRAHFGELSAPHDNARRPGAFYYAPPEQIYQYHAPERVAARLAGDLYLLGSMLDFFVTGKPTTVRLIDALKDEHRPFVHNANGWRGFFLDVLPHLQDAHAALVVEFAKAVHDTLDETQAGLANELVTLFVYSTNPDPSKRGHPAPRAMKQTSDYDLQRFISAFSALSKKLALAEKAQNAVRAS